MVCAAVFVIFRTLVQTSEERELCMHFSVDKIEKKRKEKNLHLLSGEQYVSPLVDLPDESLCFPHAVVALPLPLQVLHLQEIQCGSKEWDRSPQKCREQEKQVKRDNWKNRSEVMRKRGTDMEEGIRGKGLKQRCKETGRSSV